ncbi:MAG: magnesium chelatase, partial [Candidatus Tectomicrobia bacterium]|nr:magnesium chelatase [Candidatus Tectomicrobia bacterium]
MQRKEWRDIRTLGALRAANYPVLTVKGEMRKNMIERVRRGEELFPGIIGYEETVIPQLQNAILSGQDVIFLGERGQAKSRLIRSLINLLDEEIPVIADCEINDNPHHPICKRCKELVKQQGDEVEISWLPREERYSEKLATPDVTTADLIGEIDPIKVAEGRYLSDELTIHYGLVPRTNRGIFAINELPDLSEKIQVGLFNIMEERDVQIRGFRIRLPLDIYLVASANPEDYTNRGRIITPHKDRNGTEIRTHYPRTIQEEIRIVENERKVFHDEGYQLKMPGFMKEIIAEVTSQARQSPYVNQRSGVSVRMTINNYENIFSNAFRRALKLGEDKVVPRISDLSSIFPSTSGKVELESLEEEKGQQILEDLIKKAIKLVFDRHFKVSSFEAFIARFNSGKKIEVSAEM